MPNALQVTASAVLALAALVGSQSPVPGDELLFNQVQVRVLRSAAICCAMVASSPWIYAAESDLEPWVLLQFVGTDQSHHQAPPQAVLDLLYQPLYQTAFANSTLDLPQGYLFSHLSIINQLNAGESVPLMQTLLPSRYFIFTACQAPRG